MTAFTNNSNKALKELKNRAHKVHGVDGIPIQADSACGSPFSNTAESASILDVDTYESGTPVHKREKKWNGKQ